MFGALTKFWAFAASIPLTKRAQGLFLRGEFVGAKALMEESLNRLTTTVGPDHCATIAVAKNLAAVYRELGDLARCRALQEQVFTSLSSSRQVSSQPLFNLELKRIVYWMDLPRVTRNVDTQTILPITLERTLRMATKQIPMSEAFSFCSKLSGCALPRNSCAAFGHPKTVLRVREHVGFGVFGILVISVGQRRKVALVRSKSFAPNARFTCKNSSLRNNCSAGIS